MRDLNWTRYLLLLLLHFSPILNAKESAELSASNIIFETAEPIYVVGDIHGDFDAITQSLRSINLVDSDLNWIGGKSHFVSLGDLLDRGPNSRKVLDLFIKLQDQAADSGGKFHVVLGNHEVMTMIGDLRYVSSSEVAEFANDETAVQRDAAFTDFIEARGLVANEELHQKFDKTYPPGYFARMDAFKLTGTYGKWLTQLPFAIKINDQIFTHGGLSKKVESFNIVEFNQELNNVLVDYLSLWGSAIKKKSLSFDMDLLTRKKTAAQLKRFAKQRKFLKKSDHWLFSNDSPTWFRGNAICHPYFEADNLTKRLKHWNASRLWVGHTTSQTRSPLFRLNDQLVIMDTGMLNEYYGGEPWVAKIELGEPILFLKGASGQEGKASQSPNREWSNPYNFTDKQVEKFMLTAEIKKVGTTKEGKTNPFKVEMRKNGKMIKGIFKYKDSSPFAEKGSWVTDKNYADRYQHEMAAYNLDRMLGIGLVPVTVQRKVDGKSGIVQVWIDDLTSELYLKDNKLPYVGDCSQSDQDNLINTFDYLIGNRDRNQSNVLYSKSDMQIWFIDHSRAFGESIKRPKMLKRTKIRASKALKKKLEKLNYDDLQILRPWLHARQIKGILKRAKRLLNDKA